MAASLPEPVHRLEVSLRHRIGPLALDVSFTLDKPWTVLFAPSGMGKSTVLRVTAGLVKPDEGRIVSMLSSDDKRITLTDTASGIFIPPHQRNIRFISQHAALFPHKTVRENIRYGVRVEEEQGLAGILRICRVEHLLEKMPQGLSGGECQRVALARALGPGRARALLLDEPFTGLDVALRDALALDLKRWLASRGIPVLHVTHDVGEVFALADEVIRMESGRVVSQGLTAVVMRGERERLIEQLGGMR